jgi:PRTRC genetic system protein C
MPLRHRHAQSSLTRCDFLRLRAGVQQLKTTVNKRVFKHNGNPLSDPDTSMSPAAVKDLYSAMYPELLNAEIKGPDVVADELVYTFHRTTGTKGAGAVKARPSAKSQSNTSSFVRRLEIAAGETSKPTASIPASKLNAVRLVMQPIIGSQSLTLPSPSFALLL